MQKNNSAFTLIEILVTSVILILISTVSITTFQSVFEEQSLRKEVEGGFALIHSLFEKQSSYQVEYIVNEDYFLYGLWGWIKQTLVKSGSWFLLFTNDKTQNLWNISINIDNQEFINKSILSQESFYFPSKQNKKITITWTIEWKTLHAINYQPFSYLDSNNRIVLNSIVDKNNNSYTGVIITGNASWFRKKIFRSPSWDAIEWPLQLEFEANKLKIKIPFE